MRIRKEIMTNEDFRLISKAGDALGHPARVAIFRFIYTKNLAREPVCNKDIVNEFDYAQSTVSQHMNKLTGSGLIQVQSKGSSNFYFVNLGMLGQYINAIKKLNQ